MSAIGQPPAPGGPKAAASKKKRQQQIALAIGAGAVLLIFLFTRSSSAGNAADPAAQTATLPNYAGAGMDGGGSGGGGSTDSSTPSYIVGPQGDPGPQGPAGDPGAPGLDAQPAPSTPSSSVGQPAGAASSASKAAGLKVAQTGPRAGQSFKTVVAHGTVYHQYVSAAGKKTNIPVRPASSANAGPRAPSSTTSHPSGSVGAPAARPVAAAPSHPATTQRLFDWGDGHGRVHTISLAEHRANTHH